MGDKLNVTNTERKRVGSTTSRTGKVGVKGQLSRLINYSISSYSFEEKCLMNDNRQDSSNRADSGPRKASVSVQFTTMENYFTINFIRRKVENVDNQGDTARVDFHS